jgi:hypothetical protein
VFTETFNVTQHAKGMTRIAFPTNRTSTTTAKVDWYSITPSITITNQSTARFALDSSVCECSWCETGLAVYCIGGAPNAAQ